MRITVVTEGTYPFHHGGVSVWTDQVVQAMPDHQFQVVALTAHGNEQSQWPYPENVRHLQTVALWPGQVPISRRVGRRAQRRFGAAWATLADASLGASVSVKALDDAWRILCDPSVGAHASSLVQGKIGIEVALESFLRARTDGRIATEAMPSLHDVISCLGHVAAAFRPLAVAPVDADVVHAVSNGLAALPCLVTHWANGTPFVVSEHGVYLRERLLALGGSATPPGARLLLQGLTREIVAVAYRHATLLAPGNQYNRRWELELGASPERIVTTYNGVDEMSFPVQDEPARATVVFAGRIDPIKDVHTLLRSFALVRQRVPNALLRVFGPTTAGNQAYAQSCRDLSIELGLGDSVQFEGRVADIADAYHAAQVVVLSSISEGFPYTVIEAMCCSRPVVATDVGGNAEAVGDTGFVVPPRDPAAMADACVALLGDANLRNDMGSRARERVLEHFTLDTAMATMRDVYRVASMSGTADDIGSAVASATATFKAGSSLAGSSPVVTAESLNLRTVGLESSTASSG